MLKDHFPVNSLSHEDERENAEDSRKKNIKIETHENIVSIRPSS